NCFRQVIDGGGTVQIADKAIGPCCPTPKILCVANHMQFKWRLASVKERRGNLSKEIHDTLDGNDCRRVVFQSSQAITVFGSMNMDHIRLQLEQDPSYLSP